MAKDDHAPRDGHPFLAGGGELACLIAGFDWAGTPLGDIANWPQSLKTTVALVLRSRVPMVTLWGADGIMIYNDAYSVFAAERHPRLLGSKVREGWPEVADFNDNVMKTGLAGGTLAYKDQELTLYRTGHAEQVWMDLDYSPILDESGQPAGVIAIVIETTAKVQAEAAVRASEAQFRMFAQAMPNHVWTAPPDGLLDWFNDRVYAYSGASAGDLDGLRWTAIVHPDDLPLAAERWAACLSAGQTYETEFRLRRADGVYRWHLARAQAIRGPAGEIIRWIGTNTDIEDHKVAAQALAHLNETLEQQVADRTADRDRIWRLIPDLLMVGSLDGYLLETNPAWETVLGYDEKTLRARPFRDIIHPDFVNVSREVLAAMKAGRTARNQNQIRRADGEYRWFDWVGAPVGDNEFIAIARDITQAKERQAELERTQEQLRQSQKMEAVGQLTGGIAHDFNNLLQGITGSLELLQKRAGQGRVGELDRFILGAMASAKRASALTHRLLAFSRRQPLDPRPVRANPLVASMEDLLRRTLGERVELELVLAGGLWTTLCDPNQLENAILNLAINARDAMPDGGKLTIETGNAHLDGAFARQQDVRPGQYVCVSVTDTGTGMSPDTLAKAFEPFFTTKPIGQGTGLGLSMIYGFARQSEGSAKIYSELGEGTTFRLYLPRHRAEAAEDEAPPELTDVHAADPGETVLVVEDEVVVRSLIVEVLSELGYRALEAADGPTGLQILQSRRRIDLLITDIGLPGLNGRQVADAGRTLRPTLKVLFMTGYAENAAFASGFLEPGMAMITKPFVMEDLATRIRGIIEHED